MSERWRGHVGLIKPTYRGKSFAFWYRHLPEGVECSPAVIGFNSGNEKTFADEGSTFRRAEQLAEELREFGCEIIVISGSPPYLLKGIKYEQEWRYGLSERLGVPVVTGMEPHVLAAHVLGIKRIALITYFGHKLLASIGDYFNEYDIESVAVPGFAATEHHEGLYATPMLRLNDVSHEDVYKQVKKSIGEMEGAVDGVYINGGGWDAAPVLGYLEQDLGIPVIWALEAELWLTLGILRVADPIHGFGRLLSDPVVRSHPAIQKWRQH